MAIEDGKSKVVSVETPTFNTSLELGVFWDKIIDDTSASDGPLPWFEVFSRSFRAHAPAAPYLQLLPLLSQIADPDTIPGAPVQMGENRPSRLLGSILKRQIHFARNLAKERTGHDFLYVQDLLFFGLLRCAMLVSEMGQSAPRYQNQGLSRENLTILAFELAIMSLGPNDRAASLSEHDETELGLERLLPGGNDQGTEHVDIRRRLTNMFISVEPIEPYAQGVALALRDDPWAEGLTDRSGAESEIAAFAAMFTARDFQPPLSIGVFGNRSAS